MYDAIFATACTAFAVGLWVGCALTKRAKRGDLEEIDRNARAYGWEIGHGHPLADVIESTDATNPFLTREWRAEL